MLDEKTVYNYIDAGLLSEGNFDHPRKVRYRVRKKKPIKVDKQCHAGRTYEDFETYMVTNPDVSVVEMDSAEGRKRRNGIPNYLLPQLHLHVGIQP